MFRFFTDLSFNRIETHLIGGNHETIANGIDTYKFLNDMMPPGVTYRDKDVIKLKDHNTMLHFMSHCNLPKDTAAHADAMEQFIDDCGIDRHVLITHVRATVGEYVKEEVDIKGLCSPYCLVVAGDIHTELKIDNLVYVNQPINSAYASSVSTSYLLLTLDEGHIEYQWVPTMLPSLIQWTRDAADFEQVCGEVEKHFKGNMDVMGATDFIKINLSGSLKELRRINADAENVKINKIPIVEDTIVNEVGYEKAVEVISTDMQLLEYLKLVPYTEENIHSLLEIWKEVA